MNEDTEFVWKREATIRHSQRLLRSFKHWTGNFPIDVGGSAEENARSLFEAPFVLVSHGVEKDPIFNYGNQKALELWQMDWEEFTRMPSRYTAEPIEQSERDRLLIQTRIQGFVSNFSGVRIDSQGKRFLIENGIIWNVLDEDDRICGQAAVYSQCTPLIASVT